MRDNRVGLETFLASILNVKNKYFNENYTTYEELSYICDLIKLDLSINKINIIILYRMTDDFIFEDSEILRINENKNESVTDIYNKYYCLLNNKLLKQVIFSEKLMLNYVNDYKQLIARNKTLQKKNAD